MRLTEEEYQQGEESEALDLSAGPQVSISNLKNISLSASPVPIPPTIVIGDDWNGTSCTVSPLRGRLISGMTIICKDEGVKVTLLIPTISTIPACKGDLYKHPEFDITGKQIGWTMEPLGNQAVGFSVHFTMGTPPRVVAVLLCAFPTEVEKRVGVCTWIAS